jgi:hypothetical protein
VRVTSPVHPLFGRLVQASGFKRWDGTVMLVVALPDGTPGTIPADATDVLGDPDPPEPTSVLSVPGVQRLRMLVDALVSPASRSRSAPKTCK